MIETFVILGFGIVGSAVLFTAFFRTPKSGKVLGAGLSEVSKQILKEYNALPEESRPFLNIINILQDLDKMTAVDSFDRRQHFNQNWLNLIKVENGGFRFDWHTGGCSHRGEYQCKFHDYYRLHTLIKEVQDAVNEKERAFAASSVDRDSIADLEASLRSEAEITKSVTKEIKGH